MLDTSGIKMVVLILLMRNMGLRFYSLIPESVRIEHYNSLGGEGPCGIYCSNGGLGK
jgi:hypothetical protein